MTRRKIVPALIGLAGLIAGSLVTAPAPPAVAQTEVPLSFPDQGLNASEEPLFRKALPMLLADTTNVDLVVTYRPDSKRREGCKRAGDIYWIYSKRGTVCFTRHPKGPGWRFRVQVIRGRNPVRKQSATALATLAQERAVSTFTDEAEPRNLINPKKITYPYVYERIVAEFDGPRAGDFIIVPNNLADHANPGAHGHLDVTQSRTTLVLSGRGARRSPLSPKAEKKLRIRNVDLAPTVARALGINPYFEDTGEPAATLNGRPSKSALLKRQDGRVLDALLEPVYNTFIVSIDGLHPEFVTPTLMPNLHALLDEECAPGGTCATAYEQARAMMVSETNGNHTAMITGAYGERSGIIANNTFDRSAGEEISLDRPELNLAETLVDRIETTKPWLRTAVVMGKEKLRSLFDCTRNDEGECAVSSNNPESEPVRHLAPDFLGGAAAAPTDERLDCPSEPGSGSGYSSNACTMDVALRLLLEEDPDLTFINLPEVDAFSHLFGRNSPQAQAAVTSSDLQLGRLVDALKASGRWQRSTMIVTADHNFGETQGPQNGIRLDQALEGAGSEAFELVTYDGSASVYLTDKEDPAAPLTKDEQDSLKALREAALATEGVTDALYRLPNPADGGDRFTLDAVHPAWRLSGTERVGELYITAAEDSFFATSQSDSNQVIAGKHGHPEDRHVPFFVMSGGTYVRDGSVAPTGDVDERDDTLVNKTQAENVDIAPTLAWILGVRAPKHNQGRVLSEAFVKHPAKAERAGEITEPIANRAAIFIYDQNNSVTVHCLIDPRTCGDPIPPEAEDPGTIPNLRALIENGMLATYGSMSAWPTVTMPNHNTVGSGAYPGHHGMVNNRFYDRDTKTLHEPIDPQDPDNPLYVGTSVLLNDEFETLHEALHRTYGDWEPQDGPTSDKAYTASVDEPSARGADYATLEPADSFPNPANYIATQEPSELAQDTTQSCAEDQGYMTESVLDHQGQTQARRLFEDNGQHPLPTYLINNFTITDGAGHHFGPHTTCTIAAFRDSDKRLGRILGAMRSAGTLGETLVIVTGDHGGENQDLERAGLPSDFEAALNDAGIKHVMADWHVYLLTMDVGISPSRLARGSETEVTFTVTDNDTGAPIEGATVSVVGGDVSGATSAEGTVALTLTPAGKKVRFLVEHADFNGATVSRKTRRR